MIKPNTTVWLSDPAKLPLLTPMPAGVREVAALATIGGRRSGLRFRANKAGEGKFTGGAE